MPTLDLLSTIEVPRWVKKVGVQPLLVSTRQELYAAVADGWVLRLPVPTGIVLTDGEAPFTPPVGMVDDPDAFTDAPQPDDDEPDVPDVPEPDAPVRRGPGRPRKNG